MSEHGRLASFTSSFRSRLVRCMLKMGKEEETSGLQSLDSLLATVSSSLPFGNKFQNCRRAIHNTLVGGVFSKHIFEQVLRSKFNNSYDIEVKRFLFCRSSIIILAALQERATKLLSHLCGAAFYFCYEIFAKGDMLKNKVVKY